MKQDIPEETIGRFLLDVAVNCAVIIVMFLLVQKVIAAPFQVVGNSMDNTLQDGEYIVVSKLDYLFGEPERGDVIVFHPPQNKKNFYIKRIIGTPGDTVRINGGKVSVNGKTLNETYLPKTLRTCLTAYLQECEQEDKSYIVPEKKYFVLGDNRTGSSDSRAWYDDNNNPDPFVDYKQIQGKTRIVLWPITEARLISDVE